MNVLVIDNIDSFVYNLVQYVGELGANPIVLQNTVSMSRVKAVVREKDIVGIIISPGPKAPKDAKVSNDIIREYGPKMPLLGVCLGHQCIGYVYGGKIRRARTLMHGKTSLIKHNIKGLFKNIRNPLEATRYHSLVIDDKSVPKCINITARSLDDGEIMAVQHKKYPVYGVQFHPESILTKEGMRIIKNFIGVVGEWGS